MIVGLIGKKGHGKDTFADYLVKEYGFVKLSFAEPLKRVCKELFLLTDRQLYDCHEKEKVDERWGKSPRQLMQIIGTDILRKYYDEDIWVNLLLKNMEQNLNKNIVICDIRHPNELDAVMSFQKSQDVKIYRIERDNYTISDSHITENFQLENNSIEIIKNNNNLDCLYQKIKTLFQVYFK
jgi:dephospho-CoA kinase